jgi:ribosomal protein L44E
MPYSDDPESSGFCTSCQEHEANLDRMRAEQVREMKEGEREEEERWEKEYGHLL